MPSRASRRGRSSPVGACAVLSMWVASACGGRTNLSPSSSVDGGNDENANAAPADSGVGDATAADAGKLECTSPCIENQTRCAADAVQTCLLQPSGCTQWVATSTCGANQSCTSSGGAASCACLPSVCLAAGTACQDSRTLATCAQDTNGCFFEASTATCPAATSCSGFAPNATCSSRCSDSCVQGQSSCVSGSLTTCTIGSDGCWAYGTPAACGVHQTCTGVSGAAQCTCNASPTCAAVGSLCSSRSTLTTCASDGQGCVYEASSSPCAGTTPACLNDACVACAPGTARCAGNNLQTCNASGQWQAGTPCKGSTPVCAGGVCTALPPSCQVNAAGTTHCGAAGDSCCTSLEVTGGTYFRTYTNDGTGATGLADPATVSTFRLDKYDVTLGRFRQFVAAWNAGWTPAEGSGKHTHLNRGKGLADSSRPGNYEPGWVTADNSNVAPTDANLANPGIDCNRWTSAPGKWETLPVGCVNWFESYAFCIWDGGFLPSEAEWEYAAAGGSQEREYPWGSTPPGTTNQYSIYYCFYPPNGPTDPYGCGDHYPNLVRIAPVGSAALGEGLWGQLDLAGNVWQWNMDWFSAPYIEPCVDCAFFTEVKVTVNRTLRDGRIFRGGSAWTSLDSLLPPFRSEGPPWVRDDTVGFRCARTP